MLQIAITGLGFMAVAHLRALRHIPNARVVAICNPSGRNLDGDLSQVSGNIGSTEPVRLDMSEVKAYRDFNEMLADKRVDVVDICTPTTSHPELAIAALKAGKHVLCEKPLARTSALGREMLAISKQSRGFLMPAMCLRFWPEWAWLHAAIKEGRFGSVLDARFRRVAQAPGWGQKNYFDGQQSGGALFDLHIHDTDFVQFCFGRPQSVFSAGHTKISGAIDHVVTLYQVESGATISAEGSWGMTDGFGFNMAFTVNFENATADYDIARGPECLRLIEKGKEPRFVKCEGVDGYVGELKHFLECIELGHPPSIVTGEEGLGAVEICEAEEASIRSGQSVKL